MKNKISTALILLAAAVILQTSCGSGSKENIESDFASAVSTEPATTESAPVEDTTEALQNETTAPEEEYVSPIDFESLKASNSDIYAWIEIPDTPVSYPILNRAGDNSYYLRRNSERKYDVKGCIFTEDYNSLDFTDPVTVIYGHTMKSGEFFGSFEKNYSNPTYFEEHRRVNIYLPDKELHYKVYAALPYYTTHLLYYYNFSNRLVFNSFFDDISSTRVLNATIDAESQPEFGEKVIVLSTCLLNDSTQRFLVLAVEETED